MDKKTDGQANYNDKKTEETEPLVSQSSSSIEKNKGLLSKTRDGLVSLITWRRTGSTSSETVSQQQQQSSSSSPQQLTTSVVQYEPKHANSVQNQLSIPVSKKEKADSIVAKYLSDENNEEDSALLRVLSDPLDTERAINKAEEGRRMEREAEAIKAELDTVTEVLKEMELVDGQVYNKEEETKSILRASFEKDQKGLESQLKDLERKMDWSTKELDSINKEMDKLQKLLEELELKKQQVGLQLAETQSIAIKTKQELDLRQIAFTKEMREVEDSCVLRRETDFEVMQRYKAAKVQLENALDDRQTCKRIITGQQPKSSNLRSTSESNKSVVSVASSQDAPSQRKESLSVLNANTLSVASKPSIDQSLHPVSPQEETDSEKAMGTNVQCILSLTGPKEIQRESALTEMKVFRKDKQPIRQTNLTRVYAGQLDKKQICIKVIVLKSGDHSLKALESRLNSYGFKILRYIANCPHPAVAEVYDIFYIKGHKSIVLEQYLTTDLKQYIRKEGPLGEEKAKVHSRSLASAVHYLHTNGIAHQNLSATNIFIDDTQNLRLASLEFSIICYNVDKKRIRFQKADIQGKHALFVAPEVSSGQEYNPMLADIFSFGVMVVYMVHGNYIVQSEANHIEERLKAQESVERVLNEFGRNLVYTCLQVEPQHRLKSGQILEHSWFSK